MEKIKIIGLCGSARKNSYNMSVLNYIKNNHQEDIEFESLDITNLPMFNQDLEENLPQTVKEFILQLKSADGFLIVTPEHNYSIPALLKNALDWGSRSDEQVFNQKPVSLISASPGMLGGARVQYQLRQVFVCLNLISLNRPEVFISKVHDKIDENGNITDEYTKKKVIEIFRELVNTVKKTQFDD